MTKVLVTGANGMLGQDLCPILLENNYEVFKTDVSNMDITNYDEVNNVLNEIKPDIVIHCAAYTNVDKAEEDIETARKINSQGTENIAIACSKTNAEMVYISTDYVFSGDNNKPYLPSDKTNPINNYGLTKFEGEEAVRKHLNKYYIARTSWLYGIHGKNFVETMLALAGAKTSCIEQKEVSSKPIKVVDDQIGCPTWTVELINGILKLIKSKNYGTHHICGSGYTSWYGFAKKVFELAKTDVNLKPCTTEEFPRPAKRPKYSVMENYGITRNWQEALKDYMSLRNNVC